MTISQSAVADVVRMRRTIHAFKPEPPPVAQLQAALSLACWAPNHHRTEPWRFYTLGPRAQALLAERNAELTRAKKGDRAAEVKLAGGEGVGLFRSEFMFMNRETIPDEDAQTEAYRAIIEAMNGDPVCIRARLLASCRNSPTRVPVKAPSNAGPAISSAIA